MKPPASYKEMMVSARDAVLAVFLERVDDHAVGGRDQHLGMLRGVSKMCFRCEACVKRLCECLPVSTAILCIRCQKSSSGYGPHNRGLSCDPKGSRAFLPNKFQCPPMVGV